MNKQVIIIRKDLNMRKGKMCAQAAHASMKVFFDRAVPQSDPFCLDAETNNIILLCSPEMKEWALNEKFTKIVVRCNNLEELLDLERQAKAAEIPCAIIEDSGATEFKSYHCVVCDSTDLKIFKDDTIIDNEWRNKNRYMCLACDTVFEIDNAIVKNKPTITCLAIGPDNAEKINKITGHLKPL
jgi:peptidyl-tRNA hydrolase, PTH2 family